MANQSTVVVHYDINGNLAFLFCGPVDVFVVDDRCPVDRVYRCTVKSNLRQISDVLGDDPIGHIGDGHIVNARDTGGLN